MKKLWLIRHGESTANAGLTTDYTADIPLTGTGWKQAKKIRLLFNQEPSLIIVSPYLRTQQTAAPTISIFPNIPRQVWYIQEFNYLAPSTCKGATAAELRKRVIDYWNACDPDYIDGEGAESFSHMLWRVQVMFNCLSQLKSGFVAIFTHGLFMQAAYLLSTEHFNDSVYLMRRFLELERCHPIANAEILKGRIYNVPLAYLSYTEKAE